MLCAIPRLAALASVPSSSAGKQACGNRQHGESREVFQLVVLVLAAVERFGETCANARLPIHLEVRHLPRRLVAKDDEEGKARGRECDGGQSSAHGKRSTNTTSGFKFLCRSPLTPIADRCPRGLHTAESDMGLRTPEPGWLSGYPRSRPTSVKPPGVRLK